MATASLANLIDLVRRSQVLPAEQQHELTHSLRGSFREPRELARELIRRRWLTPYQINQIAAGRGQDLLLGQYIVLERIGEGGMGQVFKARHRSINRLVALKVVRKECVDNPTVIRRFQREVQMVAQLHHPHIVRAFDADQIENTYYFVMEYIEGVDLAKLVKEHGPLRLLQACDYLRQAALGLQHAHEHGMIHRDIKPANLLVSRPESLDKGHSTLLPRPYSQALQWGVVKILDMGLARLQDRDDQPVGTMLTQVGSVMGTPDFIAPEQARSSRSADIRSDLYSLGCTGYYLLTSQIPFPRGTLTEKLLHHQLDEPEPLEQVRSGRLFEKLRPDNSQSYRDDPALLAAVSGLIRRLMAKRPEDRLQTPAEVADALTDLVQHTLRPAPRSTASLKRPKATNSAALAAPPEPFVVGAKGPVTGAKATTILALPKATALIPRPRRFRLGHNVVWGFLLVMFTGLSLGVVLSWLPGLAPRSEEVVAHPAPSRPTLTEAELAWQKLQGRLEQPERDAAQLRRDLIDFRCRFPHTSEALRVPETLMRLPSPLDKISPEKSSTMVLFKEQKVWHPKPVIAVLGERKPAVVNGVHCVAFSPDGSWIARGAGDGSVRLWETATLREGPKMTGHNGVVSALVFAPDGKTLATAGHDGVVHLWETSGKRLNSWREYKKDVLALTFHPEGKFLLSLGKDGTLKILDPKLPKATRTVEGRKDFWPVSLAVTPDGATLACGQVDGKVRLYSLEKQQLLATLTVQTGPIRVLVFNHDGKILLTGGPDGGLKLHAWDGQQLRERCALKGHKGTLQGAVFSPDGKRLVTSAADRSVRLWEVASGKKLHDQEGLLQSVGPLALAPDGRHLAVAGPNPVVYLVRLASSSAPR